PSTPYRRQIGRENAHAGFAVRKLADVEILLEAGAGASDDDTLVALDAGAAAFGDAHLAAHGVARLEFGQLALGFDLGGLLGLELTDEIHLKYPLLVLPTARASSTRLAVPLTARLCPLPKA